MPTFLAELDNKFNILLKKKAILKKDLLDLKSFIINEYDNDNRIDIEELKKCQRKILINFDDNDSDDYE
jgi:hypothetical protein